MIVFLDECLLNCDWSDDSRLARLETLVALEGNGEHFVHGKRRTLSGLSEISGLSRLSVATIRYILTKHADRSAVFDAAPFVARVYGVESESCILKELRFNIDIDEVGDGIFEGRTKLVVEHGVNDGVIIEIILDYVQKVTRLSAFSRGLEIIHGGGGAMASEMHRRLELHRTVLCLADSDRSYATDSLGSTALACLDEYQLFCIKNPCPSGRVFVLDGVRELENIVPLWIIENLRDRRYVDAETFESYSKFLRQGVLNSRQVVEFLRYCDLKSGFGPTGNPSVIGNVVVPSLCGSVCKTIATSRRSHPSDFVNYRRTIMEKLEKWPVFEFVRDIFEEIHWYTLGGQRRGIS